MPNPRFEEHPALQNASLTQRTIAYLEMTRGLFELQECAEKKLLSPGAEIQERRRELMEWAELLVIEWREMLEGKPAGRVN